MTEDPYKTPGADHGVIDQAPHEEVVRRDHLNTETTVKAIGSVCIVTGLLCLIGIFMAHRIQLPIDFLVETSAGESSLTPFPFIFSATFLLLGYGLEKLSQAAAILAGAFAFLALWIFPVGTIIGLAILCQLLSRKGRFVLTPYYHEIIKATPHIRYRTSILGWIALFLLPALLFMVVLALAGLASFF
jgi:hypothetical protein